MAILATIDWLDDKNDHAMDRCALSKINPKYGEAYAIAAHFFVINRRYEEGIKMYRKALNLDPSLQSARSELGVNLMRLGKEDEARQQLEECYNAGYQSPETVNTLKLLDSYKNYVTFKTPTTILRLEKKEAKLLRPYFQAELDSALATYEKKYHFKLKTSGAGGGVSESRGFRGAHHGHARNRRAGRDVRICRRDGFAQRTQAGSVPLGRTMWHELSHVYVLAMTNTACRAGSPKGWRCMRKRRRHRIRATGATDWITNRSWRSRNKKLLPMAEIDRGFVHPTYPSQVIVSYFQGGKICTFIVQKWGYDKILAMIHDFGERIVRRPT